MRIAIIEDEIPNYLGLKNMLEELLPGCRVEEPLPSNAAVREYFTRGNLPDLVFSDIRLSDGLVFDAFNGLPCEVRIIFTTAYSEYALQAFRYNSVHYLLKPIQKEELEAAVKKAQLHHPENLSGIRELTGAGKQKELRKRYLVSHKDGFEIIYTKDILFFQYDCGILYLVNTKGEKYNLDTTIDTCEEELDKETFFRANRQFIVNVNAIERLVSYWDRKMKICIKGFPQLEILVSRAKSKELKQWLDR